MTWYFFSMEFYERFLSELTILPSPVRLFTIGIIAVAVVIIFFLLGRKIGRLEGMRHTADDVRRGRADAVKRSRAVLGGQAAEQVAPFLPGFPCNPADVRFIGKPVDFIGFPGAAEGKPVSEILFIEVKTGSSALSKREREIRDAVACRRVRYIEYRCNEDT